MIKAELKRCISIERRWNRNEVSRGSPDKEDISIIIIIIIIDGGGVTLCWGAAGARARPLSGARRGAVRSHAVWPGARHRRRLVRRTGADRQV